MGCYLKAMILYRFDEYKKFRIKEMQTCLFVVILTGFILITYTNGKRAVSDEQDKSNAADEQDNANADNEQAIKVREFVDDDDSVLKAVDQPLTRREFFGRRQSSDFTANQRLFQDLMLKAHNKYRARHCVPNLKLDDSINRSAQKYAEYLARIDRMVHSHTNGLGENLFWKWSSNPLKTFSGEWSLWRFR